LPTIYVCSDEDSAAIPITENSVKGKAGSKVFNVGNGNRNVFSITLRPRPSTVVDLYTGANAAALVGTNGWMDSVVPNVNYYGLTAYFQNLYAGNAGITTASIQFDFTYNISFKGAQNLF